MSRADIIKEASAHIGTVGGAWAKRVFGGGTNDAWCAEFAWSVYATCGVNAPHSAFTPNWVSWARREGRWHTPGDGFTPSPGDAVMFMWDTVNPKGRGTPPVCHIGIVEQHRGLRNVVTIEGNTSSTISGSQYNGNTCARRVRTGNTIVGYIDMSGLADGKKPPTVASGNITVGMIGDKVKAVQEKLKKHGFNPGNIDGDFGPKTLAAVIAFQGANGLDQDGIVGPLTLAKLATEPAATVALSGGFTCAKVQRAVHVTDDNVWGPHTDEAVDAVRAASAFGGRHFPYGVKAAQRAVGASPDSNWGPRSRTAHDVTVGRIQVAVGAIADQVWGSETEGRVRAAKAAAVKP